MSISQFVKESNMLVKKRNCQNESIMLDPLVSPLVHAMNQGGLFVTIASCQGHGWKAMAPYIYFQAPIELVQSFCRLLREDSLKAKTSLHYYWEIEGRFDMQYQLCWSLISPSLERYCLWQRSKVNQDFNQLRLMVEQMGFKEPIPACQNDH